MRFTLPAYIVLAVTACVRTRGRHPLRACVFSAGSPLSTVPSSPRWLTEVHKPQWTLLCLPLSRGSFWPNQTCNITESTGNFWRFLQSGGGGVSYMQHVMSQNSLQLSRTHFTTALSDDGMLYLHLLQQTDKAALARNERTGWDGSTHEHISSFLILCSMKYTGSIAWCPP